MRLLEQNGLAFPFSEYYPQALLGRVGWGLSGAPRDAQGPWLPRRAELRVLLPPVQWRWVLRCRLKVLFCWSGSICSGHPE